MDQNDISKLTPERFQKLLEEIRHQVSSFIESQNISEYRFSVLAEMDPHTLYDFMKGEGNPTTKTITKILEVLEA